MKRILKDSFPLALLLAFFFLISCNAKEEKHANEAGATKYTCPMHPQVIKDEPGTCPICKMDLVPVNNNSGHAAADDSLAMLVKPTDESVLSSVKIIHPQRGDRSSEISLQGIINYNTNNWNSVSARVGGRIERLYIKYNYEAVSKGQKLMDIYSPDLVNAQQELLFLKNNGEPVLMEAAKRKLRLLGITEKQINQVLRTGQVDYTVTIYSPYSGYVAEQQNNGQSSVSQTTAGGNTITSATSGGGSSMGSMGSSGSSSNTSGNTPSLPNVASNSPLQLREGQYISSGQKLFNVINASQVWAEFYAKPEQLNEFKRGSMVTIQAVDIPGQKARVEVSLIQPYYNEGSNYSLVKATIPNANKRWKVGQLIRVSKESKGKNGTWLPRTAVFQLGSRYVSFIRRGGAFVPVYVNVHNKAGDWVEIGDSLNTSQEVAANAWFLVDSESFIKVKQL